MEFIWIFSLIIANGMFSITEMSIAASKIVRLQAIAENGDKKSQIAIRLIENPNRFLAATQIGLIVVNLVLGMFAESWIVEKINLHLSEFSFLTPTIQHMISFTLAISMVTFTSVLFGEMIPKRIALAYPETIARKMAPIMNKFIFIISPVIFVLSKATDFLLKLIGVPITAQNNPQALLDDLRFSIAAGAEAGVLDKTEHRLFENVFYLNEIVVGAIMTPRTDLIWLDTRKSAADNMSIITKTPSLRYLVAQGDLDHILGVVEASTIWQHLIKGNSLELSALQIPSIGAVPDTFNALAVLNHFKQNKTHYALVINEYGNLQGMVTLQDLLQGIVGNVPLMGQGDTLITKRKDGSWLFDGLTPIDDVKASIGLSTLPDESHGYETIAGMMIDQLGRIPKKSDNFSWEGWTFEVVDMEQHRVDEVLVTKQSLN